MLNWMNPLWWVAGIKGAFLFLKENPVGFGFTWFASGVQTMWTSAFPLSLIYPDWAREIMATVIPAVVSGWRSSVPVVQEFIATLWEWAWSGSLGP